MTYHAPTNQFTVTRDELLKASYLLKHAIRKIRQGANLELRGYDNLTRDTDAAELAEGSILNAAKTLGIDLGADAPGILDVSNCQ